MAWTYTTLVQAVKDFTEYDETTFNSYIDTFIRNCEERILFSVQLVDFRYNVTGSTSAGNKFLGLPADFLSSYSLSITVDGVTSFLLNKDVEYLQEYNPSGATGTPKYYALFDTSTLLLAPTPAGDYSAELHYYYQPPSIVDTGTSWLGDNAEQALLYGTLFEAYTFMKGDQDLLNLYNQRFAEALTRLKNYGEGMEDEDAYRDGLVKIKAT
jgi:hypothetical protein